MTAKILPASAGWRWLASGTKLMLRYPVLPILTSFVLFCTSALFMAHLLGGVFSIMLFGNIIVGLAGIYYGMEHGKSLDLSFYLRFVNGKGILLLFLSGTSLIVGILVVWLAALWIIHSYDNFTSRWLGDIIRLFNFSEASRLVAEVNDFASMLLGFYAAESCLGHAMVEDVASTRPVFYAAGVLWIFISMAYWFSPLLIVRRGMSVGKAFETSFCACLDNWKAFFVNGVIWLLVFIINYIVVLFVTPVISIAVTLILASIAFANYYFSYKTIFEEQEI
ncbi:MAG: hypothetical protein LBQ62_03500 [Candidatus Accumulibacter sp.]|jgi:hypothetical protein|nr:hypothetical protein [Accumulibacter sp.]